MQFLVYAIITSSLCFEYLGDQGYAPSSIAYAQELLAVVAVLVVVVGGVQQRFGNVAAGYWLVFGALAVTVLCGLLTNGVESGPIFAGLRAYLRAIPLFFLPAVVLFSPRQVKAQLLLVLAFAVAQLPISLDQRLTTFARGYLSGDRTIGTLADSAFLSVFLICVAAVLFAFFVRGRLSRLWALILLPIVLAPTMFNETKASLFLVPVALCRRGGGGSNEEPLAKVHGCLDERSSVPRRLRADLRLLHEAALWLRHRRVLHHGRPRRELSDARRPRWGRTRRWAK